MHYLFMCKYHCKNITIYTFLPLYHSQILSLRGEKNIKISLIFIVWKNSLPSNLFKQEWDAVINRNKTDFYSLHNWYHDKVTLNHLSSILKD